MRSYLETFDKNMRRVGILVDATDIQRRRRLNSDYELSFLLPMTSDDFRDKVQLKGYVRDERGQYYVINSRQRVRDGRKLTANIVATHVLFALADYKMPYTSYISEAYGVHISRLTDTISAATGGKFRFSIDDTFDLYDVKDWGRGNALQALNDVIKMYRVEVEPDNFTIHLRRKIGADNGLQYRIRKNIVSTNFRDEVGSLVTRMYAQMKDGRTFIGLDASYLTDEERTLLAQVPDAIANGKLAVNYLISPYQAYWASETIPYYDGEIIEQDLEDPVKLLEATRNALREQEVPALEVSVSAADLFKLDKTEPKPGLGDTVKCVDPELGLDNISARITELTEYPFALDKHAQVTVSNVMLRDYQDIIADLERSKRVVDNMFSGGRIRTDVFENFAKQVIADITNSKTEIVWPEEGGILAREKGNPLRQVRLTAAGLGVSTDGWKTVRAAITADGILAERVIGQLGNFVSMLIGTGNDVVQINTNGIAAGHANWASAKFRVNMQGDVVANGLTANWARINSSDLNSSTWRDGYFTGNITANGEITGGTITGALIRTAVSGRRVEMDRRGFRAIDTSGATRISIQTDSDQGISGIGFNDRYGSWQGQIIATADDFSMTAKNGLYFSGGAGSITFASNVNFMYGIDMSNIKNLNSELDGIKIQIGGKIGRSEFYSYSGGAHNHGIPDGTVLLTADGGKVVWRSYGGFTHTHI